MPDMGIPAEVPTDSLDTVVAPAPPEITGCGRLLKSTSKTPGFGHVHQKTVAATSLNVLGASIIRGHNGQPAGGRLEQCELSLIHI